MRKIGSIPSLTVSFVWTLAGSLSYSGSQWALIVLFAKLGNAAMVGQYAFAAAVAYPISLLANLQLRAVFVNDREGRYPFRRMLGARYLLAALALMALPFICLCMRSTRQTTALILLVGTALLMDSLSESYYSLLQKCERMDRIGRSQILKGALCLALAVAALYFTHSVLYAVCGVLFGRLLILAFYDTAPETFHIGRINSEIHDEPHASNKFLMRIRPHWNVKSQWEMIWLALPLGAVSVIASFNLSIPRYVIEHYLGPHELGIYSALSYLPYTATLFASALGYVAYARLGKFYFERDIRGFRVLLGRIALIAAGIGAAGFMLSAIAGKPILRLLYRPEYAEHSDLLLWLVVAAGLACVSSSMGVAMTAASQFRPQIPLSISVGIVSIIAALALVPKMGLYGAAIATIVSLSAQITGTYWIVQRALTRRRLSASESGGSSSVVEDVLISES